ncbi:MAG: hypothetical protein HRT70_00800 [Flavobacteriaceae bacterium]|nr:hypothetical protein [Flavobacteriaceae bacterium]
MHKKLAADLTSLAHSILQMKNKDDVFALKEKAYQVYEKLAVLAYVEEYMNHTPNPEQTREELIEKIEIASESTEKEIIESKMEKGSEDDSAGESLSEEPQDSIETSEEGKKTIEEVKNAESVIHSEIRTADISHEEVENEIKDKKEASLEKELQDTISVDIVADLFENAPKKSLNDKFLGDIKIGLNDRIAFVKHLFDESQEDFNRVISQLNTFKTAKEAKKFIHKMVKPDYNWSGKEEFEERLMMIVERKFS